MKLLLKKAKNNNHFLHIGTGDSLFRSFNNFLFLSNNNEEKGNIC